MHWRAKGRTIGAAEVRGDELLSRNVDPSLKFSLDKSSDNFWAVRACLQQDLRSSVTTAIE